MCSVHGTDLHIEANWAIFHKYVVYLTLIYLLIDVY